LIFAATGLAPGSVIINARPAGGVASAISEPPVSAGNRKSVARNTASTPSIAPPLESVSYEVQKGKPVLIPELTKIQSEGGDKKQAKASSAPANHDIIVYPPAATAVKSQSYSVEVNRAGVFTEQYKDVSYAHFAFSGKADITIDVSADIKSYSLSPESYSIPATVQADKLTFSIDRPRKLVVRINDNERLFIFADPMETNPHKFGESKVLNIMDFGIDNTGKILDT
jgi:hypothetical protein